MTDLELAREIAAPPELVWRCMTDPSHLARWWVPAPVTIRDMVLETRPGGRFGYVMVMEDGAEVPMEMMVLSAEPMRFVFTDLMVAGFRPVASPFFGFVGRLELTATATGTLYAARAAHARAGDADRHRDMGFHDGWGAVADQLKTLAEGVARKE